MTQVVIGIKKVKVLICIGYLHYSQIEVSGKSVILAYTLSISGYSEHWQIQQWADPSDQTYGLVMVREAILYLGHGGELSLKFLTFGAMEHSIAFKRRARSLSTGGVCV